MTVTYFFLFQCRVLNHVTWKLVAEHNHTHTVDSPSVVSGPGGEIFWALNPSLLFLCFGISTTSTQATLQQCFYDTFMQPLYILNWPAWLAWYCKGFFTTAVPPMKEASREISSELSNWEFSHALSPSWKFSCHLSHEILPATKENFESASKMDINPYLLSSHFSHENCYMCACVWHSELMYT